VRVSAAAAKTRPRAEEAGRKMTVRVQACSDEGVALAQLTCRALIGRIKHIRSFGNNQMENDCEQVFRIAECHGCGRHQMHGHSRKMWRPR